jgi:hypothetical protein
MGEGSVILRLIAFLLVAGGVVGFAIMAAGVLTGQFVPGPTLLYSAIGSLFSILVGALLSTFDK